MHVASSLSQHYSPLCNVFQPRRPRTPSRTVLRVSAMGLFDSFTSIFQKKTSTTNNSNVLQWARNAKPACPLAPSEAPEGLKIATFAGNTILKPPPLSSIVYPNNNNTSFPSGGCFWGLELAYMRVEGVEKTFVGYAGGSDTAPTYEKVCSGRTGHTEIVQVYYDPKECTYQQLLQEFFDKVCRTPVG